MKTNRFILLGIILSAFVACDDGLDKDISVAGVTVTENENVVREGAILNVKKGETVTFNFSGDPDNIVFYSGEEGHNYDYRNRTTIEEKQIVSSKLSLKLTASYGNNSIYDNLLNLYISDSFTGLYKDDFAADCQLLSDFQGWSEWVSQEDLPQKGGEVKTYEFVLKGNDDSGSDGESVDYLGKNVTLAIHYHPQNDTEGSQPKLVFENFYITNVLSDGSTKVISASDMGFTPVNVWSSDLETNVITNEIKGKLDDNSGYYDTSDNLIESALWYGSVTNGTDGFWNLKNAGNGELTMNSTPAAKNNGFRETWLVSDYLVINSCTPDKGEAIKNISNRLSSYEYTYENVGTYKTTFLMTNSNYKNEDSKVITMVINVK